jgi:dihydrofolate reductase
MRKIVVLETISLDGVIQAPGRPDEDLRDGFAHGGWALPYRDAVMGSILAAGMADTGPLLFGRRTYEDFFRVWPNRTDNPFTAILDQAEKYVASSTLREPLPWRNSVLLPGDAADGVARLKQQPGKDILIMGSAVLVRSLLQRRLIDVLQLLVHPLLLGSGHRLFPPDGTFTELALVDVKPTPSGVVITTYRRQEIA